MKQIGALLLVITLAFSVSIPTASAAGTGMEQGIKSLIIPGWGQYQNGDFENQSGRVKVGIMAAVELAAILTTAIVGGVAGYPQVWVGIGLFIANHVWSAFDAFVHAEKSPAVNLGTGEPGDKVQVAR